jgi:hypothetical protein
MDGRRSRRSGCCERFCCRRSTPSARSAVNGAVALQSPLSLVRGLSVDDPVWVPTVFTKNRDRLLEAEVARKFLACSSSRTRACIRPPDRRLRPARARTRAGTSSTKPSFRRVMNAFLATARFGFPVSSTAPSSRRAAADSSTSCVSVSFFGGRSGSPVDGRLSKNLQLSSASRAASSLSGVAGKLRIRAPVALWMAFMIAAPARKCPVRRVPCCRAGCRAGRARRETRHRSRRYRHSPPHGSSPGLD